MSKAQILIVDDEVGVRELLTDALQMSGYDTATAKDGADALSWLRGNRADLVICDINMPRIDGFAVVDSMRKQDDQTPVILLTARGDRSDVTHGLRIGADDYLTKPFGLEELVLRVAAVLRRTMPDTEGSSDMSIGEFWLSRDQHRVTYQGQDVDLSPTEFRLLEYLMEREGKVVSKMTLLADVWGMDFTTNTNVVDTYVSYLRKKLTPLGYSGLVTVRGVGVQLVIEK